MLRISSSAADIRRRRLGVPGRLGTSNNSDPNASIMDDLMEEDSAAEDTSFLNISESVTSEAAEASVTIANFVDAMSLEENNKFEEWVDSEQLSEVEAAVTSYEKYIDHQFDQLYADDDNTAKWFKKYGKLMVVEEIDIELLAKDEKDHLHRSSPGDIGGMNREWRKYIKRVHVLVEPKQGFYHHDYLGQYYHYQVMKKDLHSFLIDAVNQKIIPKIGGVNNCGVLDDLGVLRLNAPVYDGRIADMVFYTSATPFVVAIGRKASYKSKLDANIKDYTVGRECGDELSSEHFPYPGGGGSHKNEEDVDNSEPNFDKREFGPTFFCVIGKGINELSEFVKQIRVDCMYQFMTENNPGDGKEFVGPDNSGAASRNQKVSVNFGYVAQNCTDKSNEDVLYMNSPCLTKRYDRVKGYPGDSTMTESLSNTMYGMTDMTVAACRMLGFPIPFSKKERVHAYASKIKRGNSSEMLTGSLGGENGFGCHIDNLNGQEDGFTSNIAHFQYMRNQSIIDGKWDHKLFLQRAHQGVFSRRICECTLVRTDNVTRFGDHLQLYIHRLPRHRKDNSHESVVGSKASTHFHKLYNGEHDYCTEPHLDKLAGFYSYYAYVLSKFMNSRNEAGIPVSEMEMIETILTAVRWTPSPSGWAEVFREITSEEGSAVRKVSGLVFSKAIYEQMKNTGGTNSDHPKLRSYESSLPLFMRYIFKSIEMNGGVGVGEGPRFQNFNGKPDIDIDIELKSIRNFLSHYRNLQKSTKDAKKLFVENVGLVESDEMLLKWARSIKPISRTFIAGLSGKYHSGGVLGIGELLAQHIVGIMASIEMIDIAHLINTTFSKGNGTSQFLMESYGLNINDCRDTVIEALWPRFQSEFGIHTGHVIENGGCELGKCHTALAQCRFFDTRCCASDSFVCKISNGRLVAELADEVFVPIKFEVVSRGCDLAKSTKRFHFRVLSLPHEANKTVHWWKPSFQLATIMCGSTTIKAKNASKQRYNRSIKKQRKKKMTKRSNGNTLGDVFREFKSQGKIVASKKEMMPSRVYGQVASAQKRLTGAIRQNIHQLLLQEMRNRRYVLAGISRWNSRDITDKIIAQIGESDKIRDEFKRRALEHEALLCSLSEDVNEVGHNEYTSAVQKYFDEFNREINQILVKRDVRRVTRLPSLSVKMDPNPSWSCWQCSHIHNGIKSDSGSWIITAKEQFSYTNCYNCEAERDKPRWTCQTCEHVHVGMMQACYLSCKNEECGAPRVDHFDDVEYIDFERAADDAVVIAAFSVLADNRTIPSYYSFSNASKHNTIDLNILFKIREVLGQGDLNIEWSGTVENRNNKYYNCSITHNESIYCSNQEVFVGSKRSRTLLPFSIGLSKIGQSVYYESKAHAKLALLLVIVATKTNPETFAENTFLGPSRDFSFLTIKDCYSFDFNNGSDDTCFVKPVCVFMRTPAEILAIDLSQLEYIDFARKCIISDHREFSDNLCVSELKKVKREEIVHDLRREYFESDSKQWKSLSAFKKAYFERKSDRHYYDNVKGFMHVLTYIAPSTLFNNVQVSDRVVSTSNCAQGLGDGWIKMTVKHSPYKARTDDYFYSPHVRYRFRSLIEAKLFMKCVVTANGDEHVAMSELFEQELKNHKEEVRLKREDAKGDEKKKTSRTSTQVQNQQAIGSKRKSLMF